MKNFADNYFENLLGSFSHSQVFLSIFNKSDMCIFDSLLETSFRLWSLYKKRTKKRRNALELSWGVDR